jgi:hypothetical protein
MDMRGRILSLLFLFISTAGFPEGEIFVPGARASGMGYTSVTQSDEWSAMNNQAGLGWCRDFSIAIGVGNRFLLKELNRNNISVTLPVGKGAFGVSCSRFGYSGYSETGGWLSYGIRLWPTFTVGVALGYLQLHIDDGFPNTGRFTTQIGVQFRAGKHLCLGLHVTNPYSVGNRSGETAQVSTVIRFGMSWIILENLHTDLEVEKDLIHLPVFRAGAEYRAAKPIFIRLGYVSNPAAFTLGFGFVLRNLRLDIATSYNTLLGYSPQASLSFFIPKKNKKQQ